MELGIIFGIIIVAVVGWLIYTNDELTYKEQKELEEHIDKIINQVNKEEEEESKLKEEKID